MLRILLVARAALTLCVGAAPIDGFQQLLSGFQQQLQQYQATATTTTSNTPPSSTSLADTASLLKTLLGAVTEESRLSILVPSPSNPSNLLYKFTNNSVTPRTPGTIDLATAQTWPTLLGTSTTTAVGFMNPCSVNMPHMHIRASEVLSVEKGSLVASLLPQGNPSSSGHVVDSPDGGTALSGPLPQINATLHLYEAILFPQGSVHWQHNPTCEAAVFVAAFDSNNPGRVQIARSLFSVEGNEVLNAALGGEGVD